VLEVLLTTPLTEREIVLGLGNGIAWQFKQVFIAVCGINLLLLVAGLWGRHWNSKMVLDYIFLWGVVFSLALLTFRSARWTVIWVSLNTGRATYSMLRPLAPLLGVAFQFFFHSSELTGALAGFPTGSETETWLTGGICGTLVLLLWVWEDRTMMALLKKYLRYVGRQPLPEPADPRFKAWDIKKPFPCTRDDPEPQIRDFC
jgi:hypothetical protein